MSSISIAHTDNPRRGGRPLVYSLTETLVFILIAVALIATAALPAIARDPHVAEAKTVTAPGIRP